MPQNSEPGATSRIEINAAPQRVYELVSDPGTLAELASEYSGFRWLDGARSAEVGARFKGTNKQGRRRWNTVATITDADAGKRYAFQVTVEAGPISITGARWQYDIEPAGDSCVLTESTWDRRAGWAKTVADMALGVKDRNAHNQSNIEATLRAIKVRAEAG